jgi:pimeloyl-ACP methyl ester carboxylesterase
VPHLGGAELIAPAPARGPWPIARAVPAAALALLAACAGVPSRGHYALVNGIRVYYEVHGHGPPLFLLHGGGGSGEQFARQVPALSRHFRLILPDARAQGRTEDGPGPLTYHGMAEDVVALMDKLRIARADVMGWSDGGIVGLDLAIHHPERVDRLVSLGANFTPEGVTQESADWLEGANAGSFGPAARARYQRVAPDPDHFETAMNKLLAMWRAEPKFTLIELHSIRARTLIVAGERDDIREDHTRALAAAIPGARLWIVPGGTHTVMLDQPDLVNRTVLQFLQSPAPKSR